MKLRTVTEADEPPPRRHRDQDSSCRTYMRCPNCGTRARASCVGSSGGQTRWRVKCRACGCNGELRL